jgi:hypothetical protein
MLFKKRRSMINKYKFLLITLCILINSAQAMDDENKIDWSPDNSFLNNVKELNIKEFRCPDDEKNEANGINTSKVKPISIPLQNLKKAKDRKPTPRPKKLNNIISPHQEEKSIFHELLAEAISRNKTIEVDTKK